MDIKYCKCGCGKQIKPNRTYVSGHNKARLGSKLSEEHKAKLRLSHLGKHATEETKAKLSAIHKGELNPFYGKHHTDETKNKIGIFFLGKHLSEEHKAKISKSNKGRKLSEEQRLKLSIINTGKHLTEETKRKLSQITKLQRLKVLGLPNSIDRTGTHHSLGDIAKMSKPRSYKFNVGRRLSEETKRKISKASLGKHVTEDTKNKLSKATKEHWRNPKYRAKLSGENHVFWLGGKSFEPYTKEFNEQMKYLIRMKDGFTCQLCGIPESETTTNLPIHHIDYNKKNSMPSNLISLCNICNPKVNRNRDYWTAYFRDLLNKRQTNPKALVKKRKSVKLLQPELLKLGVNV